PIDWSAPSWGVAPSRSMRVSITHRESAAGLSGTKRHYYLDCEVLFSEEEKAIIAARSLSNQFLTLHPAVPPPPRVPHFRGPAVARRGRWARLRGRSFAVSLVGGRVSQRAWGHRPGIARLFFFLHLFLPAAPGPRREGPPTPPPLRGAPAPPLSPLPPPSPA